MPVQRLGGKLLHIVCRLVYKHIDVPLLNDIVDYSYEIMPLVETNTVVPKFADLDTS
jgi:hypothetical protein